MSDKPSIPHEDSTSHVDYNKLYDEHSVNVNGHGTPHGDTQDETPPGDTASYWRTQLHTLPAFLKRPAKQWHVHTVLGVQDFVLLYGESGHGKTHIALDLAFACATGRTFANVFTVTRPLTVAYCTGEGIGGLADRLRAVSHFYGTEDVPLYIFPDVPQLFTPTLENGALPFGMEWQAMARDGLVPAQLDVLFVDTRHNATAGARENDSGDDSIVQASMRRLRDTLGCAIVTVHHAGKNGASERGSSAIRASQDTVLRASKVGNSYTLACEKLKDAEAWHTQAFSLVCPPNMLDGVRVAWDGDAKRENSHDNSHVKRILAHLEENAGKKFTADEVGDAIGLPRAESTYVYNAMKRLADAGTVKREKDKSRGSVYVYWSATT